MEKYLLTASEIASCCFVHLGDEPTEAEIKSWCNSRGIPHVSISDMFVIADNRHIVPSYFKGESGGITLITVSLKEAVLFTSKKEAETRLAKMPKSGGRFAFKVHPLGIV